MTSDRRAGKSNRQESCVTRTARHPHPTSVYHQPSFSCAWKSDGSRTAWVHLGGELDLASVPLFEAMVEEAQSDSAMVLVDLRDLLFIDRAALAVLANRHAFARSARQSLVLLRGSGQVDRVLESTGLLYELEVVDLHVPSSTIAEAPSYVEPARFADDRDVVLQARERSPEGFWLT